MSKRTTLVSVLSLILQSCGPSDRGDPPRLTPVEPSATAEPPGDPPSEIEPNADEGCGEAGLACCAGACVDAALTCNTADVCERVATAWPAPPPDAACGKVGETCCATGDACAGSDKAQCCAACTGAPDFNCACAETFQAGGSCKLCCVVCKDGFHKESPLEVGSDQSCQQAAQGWCQSSRKVGAGDKSGWRSECG